MARCFRHDDGGDDAELTVLMDAAERAAQVPDALVDRLLSVDAAGDPARVAAALYALAARPGLVLRLDGWFRRQWWYPGDDLPVVQRVVRRLDNGRAGPVAVALASCHRDGRVRERAVATMGYPPLAPFLVLRTTDWVGPVRDRARAGLSLLLTHHPDAYLPPALGTGVRVARRTRGGFARGQLVCALLAAPRPLRDRLAAAPDRDVRRFVIDVGLPHGWWSLTELTRIAESEPDVLIRARVAEAACREAVWTRQILTLQRFAASPRTEVRALALTGLVRAGRDAEVTRYLDDEVALVRAIARDAASRAGIEPHRHYRDTVAADPSPGAIAGLVETGTATDAPLLEPLLRNGNQRVRAAAVRGLAALGAFGVEDAVALLRDPSPAVVRETARRWPGPVPSELGWELLAEHRVDRRRAGYRLLRHGSRYGQLRAALLAARDTDPKLSRRGVADATRAAREESRRATVPGLDARQRAELAALVPAAADRLGERTTRLLLALLGY